MARFKALVSFAGRYGAFEVDKEYTFNDPIAHSYIVDGYFEPIDDEAQKMAKNAQAYVVKAANDRAKKRAAELEEKRKAQAILAAAAKLVR